MTETLALTKVGVEGVLVVISALVLFVGSLYVLISAVFGSRMGYLMTATGFFAFMIILTAIWSFGAPGTPRFLGPKGDLPAWKGLAAAATLESSEIPVAKYPGGPWKEPSGALQAEADPAALAFADFLAEEANLELKERKMPGEVAGSEFEVTDVRFATVDDRMVAVGRGVAVGGGPSVLVAGYKDPGSEGFPSYLFLVVSVLGFAAHLPFLDIAEKRRKAVLTGGEQPPFLGPA